jgi:hypothetical protein
MKIIILTNAQGPDNCRGIHVGVSSRMNDRRGVKLEEDDRVCVC